MTATEGRPTPLAPGRWDASPAGVTRRAEPR